jgi:two-component system response regulator (stage 0 sporulation protein F)
MSEILSGKRLLIVDDEQDLREPIATELESLGCIVFQAKNGKEAFEIVAKEKLNAVISDIRMPGGDGVELLQRIKKRDHQFPVVMLITGFSDLSKEEAYHMGAEVILSKPFDLDELDAAVLKILIPRDKKWAIQIDEANVKRKIQKTFTALSDALSTGQIGLGRGGFFIGEPDGLTGRNELVSFNIRFESGDILHLEGTGTVRWVRKDSDDLLPAGAGIEFESLTHEMCKKVIELADSAKLIPFIPNLAAPLKNI